MYDFITRSIVDKALMLQREFEECKVALFKQRHVLNIFS